MRVCIFNRSYWPDFGATGQLLTELAEDLVSQHGCEVTVVTGYPLRYDGVLPAEEVRNGVRIIRAAGTVYDPRRFAGRAANYLSYFVSALWAALRVPRADVVLAMTDPPIIGLAGWCAARRMRAPFVFLCQDIFPEVAVLLEDFRSATVNAALQQVGRFLVSRADAVVALGDTMKRRLVDGKGANPSRVVVIDNWADCTALSPGPKDNAFTRAHGLQQAFVVMHAGNIGLSQNLDVVLDAAEQMRDDVDTRFVFVGDGARRASLQAQASARGLSQVLFLPYQPRSEMALSYAAADLFLVSLRPGLAGYIVPSKVYSILAAGRPFVAAVEDDCELVALARDHGCGVVVPPGDGVALAARIRELRSDPERLRAMGVRAREAGLLFDRARQVSAYAALFRRLSAGCRR